MSGFANTAPQGRMMRMDKDSMEKDMLRQRTGGFQKHDVYDAPITVPEADGLGYAGDADRFQTDAASADAEVRQGDLARKDQMYANRRYVWPLACQLRSTEWMLLRTRPLSHVSSLLSASLNSRMKKAGVEEERWSKIEADKKVEDDKWDMKHQNGINGKKNNSR
jgi:hypothetical protein